MYSRAYVERCTGCLGRGVGMTSLNRLLLPRHRFALAGPLENFVSWQLLEKQLKKASADERKTGIDLSGLRAKIREEIAEVDGRL